MKLGLALGLLLLLGLVISAPARLLTYVLPPGQVVLQGVSGTLWQGRAGSCLVAVSGAYLHLGEVNWRLNPLSLLLFSPELELESRWGSQQFSGRLALTGANSLSARDIEASVPASLAQQFMPVVLEGKLSARFEHLRK